MALALLTQEEDDSDDKRWFRIDIGRNHYFRLAVGSAETVSQAGVRLIRDPRWVSPVQGPLGPQALGRSRFGVLSSIFTREVQYVQMMSYRTSDRRGPAVSEIIRSHQSGGFSAPVLSLSALPFHSGPITKSLSYRPAMPQTLFLGGLLNGLVGMLPQIGELVRGLVPGPPQTGANATVGTGTPGVGGNQLLTRLTAPETIALLQQLMRQVAGGQAAATPEPLPTPSGSQQALLARTASASRFSRAQVVPLAALAPLLGQVLTPQTVQSILEAPNRHTQTIINGLTDVIKLALDADAAQMEHLRKLNPGVDDPALDRLLESMGRSLSGGEPGVKLQLFERARIRFSGVHSVPVLGETRVVFAHGRELRFIADVQLPKLKSGAAAVLAPALLELKVKDAQTLACKFVKRFPLGRVEGSGPLPVPAMLTAEECESLEAGRDYLVTLTFAWKAKSGRVLGNLITQRITLVGGAIYAGLEDYGETIELNDPGRHRDYWHRIWAGRFEPESKRIEGEIAYTAALAPTGQDRNARLDAKVETRPKDRSAMTQEARIRCGMEFSLPGLIRLLGEFAPGSAIPPADLEAIATAETFRERMSMAVRVAFKVRGRDGESFALWSYPSFKRAHLNLLAADQILETGNVASFRQGSAEFIVPVALHVLATATRERGQRDDADMGNDGAMEKIDGQTIIGRYKAGFYPVRLVAEGPSS